MTVNIGVPKEIKIHEYRVGIVPSGVRDLLAAGCTRILLDNMSDEVMSQAVEIIRHEAGQQIAIEATGGVELSSVRAIAGTGVDLISVGALTHSSPALDISLGFEPV